MACSLFCSREECSTAHFVAVFCVSWRNIFPSQQINRTKSAEVVLIHVVQNLEWFRCLASNEQKKLYTCLKVEPIKIRPGKLKQRQNCKNIISSRLRVSSRSQCKHGVCLRRFGRIVGLLQLLLKNWRWFYSHLLWIPLVSLLLSKGIAARSFTIYFCRRGLDLAKGMEQSSDTTSTACKCDSVWWAAGLW